MNHGVIDIGTNTLLLLIISPEGGTLEDLCRFGRLGEKLDATGKLDPAAIERSLEICREYRHELDRHGVEFPTVIATQALREATNAEAFITPAQEILRATVEVIAGTREAELAAGAVAQTFPELTGRPYVVVDVGGGSTEIIVTDGKRVMSAVSLPIGAVRLSERHLEHDPPLVDEIDALVDDIDKQLAPLQLPTGVCVVGTAGTATTIAALDLGLVKYDAARVTGLRLDPKVVERQLEKLLKMTVAQRRAMRGMEPERADVIAGGVAIYARLLQQVGATKFITCDRGIRWGLAYELSTGGGGHASYEP
jgi:exopolyphosphatase/guanosine-5'-triphosphate,3'-diphosphate pyrophosphatase